MVDITRDIGDVNPNTYVRSGVVKPSPVSAAVDLAKTGIALDAELAKARLRRDSEALRTIYEIGSPASIATQEAAGDALSEADQAQVNAVDAELTKKKAAVDQGRMTYNTYRLQGERLLRQAISKRPGLAAEFRQTAAFHLGTDVVGASVDILAAAESAMNKEGKEDNGDVKRMRDQLDLVGIVNANMTDAQVLSVYGQNTEAISQVLQQQARASVIKTAVDTNQGQNALNRPQATVDFLNSSNDYKVKVYTATNQIYGAIASGALDDVGTMQEINAGRAQVQGYITNLRQAAAAGDVDPNVAEKEIAALEGFSTQLEAMLTGEQSNEILKNRIESLKLYAQHVMMGQENVPQMAAAISTFTPEIMTQFVQPGGAFSKTAMLALTNALNNTGDPVANAMNAGSSASAAISTVLDRGAAKSNPQSVPALAAALNNFAGNFLGMPGQAWKSDYITGPTGYLTVLHRQREGLKKALPQAEAAQLATNVAAVAVRNQRALAYGFGREPIYATVKDKVRLGIDPKSGNFIVPTAPLTPAEAAVVDRYNRAFAGSNVIQTVATLGGTDNNAAVALLADMDRQGVVAPAGRPAAPQRPKPQPAAVPNGAFEGLDGQAVPQAWWK